MNVANDKLSIDNYMLEYIFQSSITRAHVELFRTTCRWKYARSKWTTKCNRIRVNHSPELFRDCTIPAIAVEWGRLPSFAPFPFLMKPEMIGGRVFFFSAGPIWRQRSTMERRNAIEIVKVAIIMHSARIKRTALFPSQISFLARIVHKARFYSSAHFPKREKAHLRAILLPWQQKRKRRKSRVYIIYNI